MTPRIFSKWEASSARTTRIPSASPVTVYAPGNLRDARDHLPHPVRRHPTLAVDLDEGLDRPAERGRLDVDGESPDGAVGPQPGHPALDRRGGQSHRVADRGVALARVLHEPRN